MNKLLTPYKDGIYKALFYGHCLELENGDELETDMGVRCSRNACGGWKTYKIENNTFEEIENFSVKLSDVKSKTKLPEDTFTNKAATIKKILVEHSKDKNDCIKKINFYINRAGKNLENKTEVMKAKEMIENMIEFSDLTERLNKI